VQDGAEEEVQELVHPSFICHSDEERHVETRASEEEEEESSSEEVATAYGEDDGMKWLEPEEYVESDEELLDAPAITHKQRGTSGLPDLPDAHSNLEIQPVGARYLFSLFYQLCLHSNIVFLYSFLF
jgi:hypothetical protein